MSQAQERQLVLDYFYALPPGRLLDIPCGSLWLSRALTKAGYECHAADLYAPVEASAQVHCHRIDLNRPLPFADATFDHVACIEGIEHAESTSHLLRELGRVLRPNGRLLLTTPNVLTVMSRLHYLLRGRFHGFPHLYRDIAAGEHAHINPAPLPAIEFALRRAGMRVEAILPYPVRVKSWPYWPMAGLMMAANRIELGLSRKPEAYSTLLRRLASPTLLLAETLVVSCVRETREV